MLPDIQRTIVALASGSRPAERAIVRLAGPRTRFTLEHLCTELPADFLDSDRLTWCDSTCKLPLGTADLPVTVLYWPNDRSYTGSPAAEIHLTGCLPLAELIIQQCCQLGAEPAERGEFTLRAFLSGKLDLAQAEAVLGVIEADSQQSLRTALSQLGGNLAPAIAPLRDSLIDIVAELEAGLDFVDEDIQFISADEVIVQLEDVRRQLDDFALRLDTRSSTDRVPLVVLTGLPNSGKSSLFNAMCGQPLAIVADVPGTTRDYLQQRIHTSRTSFDIIDTAGWEAQAGETPRAMAQKQLERCLEQAQLALLCIDMSDSQDDREYWQQLREAVPSKHWLIVGTKSDLLSADNAFGGFKPRAVPVVAEAMQLLTQAQQIMQADGLVITSSTDHASIEELLNRIADCLLADERGAPRDSSSGAIAVVHETAVRCRAALHAARSGIAAALENARCGGCDELVAAELRLVLHDLASIIGEVHSDDVLGEIFSRFCIGK